MSKILVTGGAGFIGSHVAEAYLEAGHQVAVLDNLSTGKKENIPAEATFYHADLTSRKTLETAFSEFKPEILNHHAAQISVNRSVREPYFDAEQNILGGINLLQVCAEHEVRRFIFASTGGALYGDAPKIPSPENTQVVPPAPYGIAKACVEHYIRFFTTEHGFESVILRYANVYGPRQDPHGEAGVVAIFAMRSIAGESCVIYGTGDQTRDFVYVKDVARANLAALEVKQGTYNVGTGNETSINALFAEFKALNDMLEVTNDDARPGEVFRSALDATRAHKDLGWEPKYDLTTGIRETYGWFRERSVQS
ncbi:NAD-dependent epimerase/dehydratase family protein [candidate division WOR-3 bacterium]|nr:NAD-dependent epimerase/dehydratase family protein [candidate division WOR-3 bacterium]